MSAPLQAEDLYRFFHAGEEETLALRGVSVRVEAGEMVAVTGPSGSGKSTLLACLAGLDEPDGGMVRIEGHQLSRRSEEQRAAIRGRRIGMLFQQANLVGHLTVEANLKLAQRLGGDHRDRDREPVGSVLEACGIDHRAHSRPRAALRRRARPRQPGGRAGKPAGDHPRRRTDAESSTR